MQYCEKCGTQLEDDALFCSGCGNKVSSVTLHDTDTISSNDSYYPEEESKEEVSQPEDIFSGSDFNNFGSQPRVNNFSYNRNDFYGVQSQNNMQYRSPDDVYYSAQGKKDDSDKKSKAIPLLIVALIVLIILSVFTIFNYIVCEHIVLNIGSSEINLYDNFSDYGDKINDIFGNDDIEDDDEEETTEYEKEKITENVTDDEKISAPVGQTDNNSTTTVPYTEPISEPSASPTEAGTYVVTTKGDNLNLRESASTSAKVVAQIPNETVVTVSEIVNNWAHINYNGTDGWASADYLKNTSENN